jgi:hypothetical protein
LRYVFDSNELLTSNGEVMFSHKPSGGLRARREACAVIDDPDPLGLCTG